MDTAGRGIRRIEFQAEEEFRRDENLLQRHGDSALEAAVAGAVTVKREERIDVSGLQSLIERSQAQGQTAVLVAIDGQATVLLALADQLKPELFEAACRRRGYPLTLRRHEGYDHGYFFIATFVDDHLRHHAAQLCG